MLTAVPVRHVNREKDGTVWFGLAYLKQFAIHTEVLLSHSNAVWRVTYYHEHELKI